MTEETVGEAGSQMPSSSNLVNKASVAASNSSGVDSTAKSSGNEQLQTNAHAGTGTVVLAVRDNKKDGPADNPRFAPGNRLSGGFVPKTFQQRYQRNNKRGGLKNLRCFPECGVQHKERGFCGRAVMIRVKRKKNEGGQQPKLVCWAHFVPATDDYAFRIGQSVDPSSILSKERTKQNPLKEWIRGKEVEDLNRLNLSEPVLVELLKERKKGEESYEISDLAFNVELKGWHYGYVSNKHSCNSRHCLEVVVFKVAECASRTDKMTTQTPLVNGDTLKGPLDSLALAAPNITMECQAVFRSTSFQLFCRRRRRFQLAPTAPISKPASKIVGKSAKARSEPEPENMSGKQGRAESKGLKSGSKQSKRPISALKKEYSSPSSSGGTNEQGDQQKQRTGGLLSLTSAIERKGLMLDLHSDDKRVREFGPTSMFWRDGELHHIELERGSPRKVADYEPMTSPDDALLLLGLKNVQEASGVFGEVT